MVYEGKTVMDPMQQDLVTKSDIMCVWVFWCTEVEDNCDCIISYDDHVMLI